MDHPNPANGTAAVSWGPDRIDLFTVDAAHQLIHRVFVSGIWEEPQSLGGQLAFPPAATPWGADAGAAAVTL